MASQLTEAVGDRTPDGGQDFLSRVQWDADAVRDDRHADVVPHLGDPDGVLILDETGFLKKGEKSAGCSGNPAAPRVGSRIARSACSSATPAVTARC
jgi:SRSO17 transposase